MEEDHTAEQQNEIVPKPNTGEPESAEAEASVQSSEPEEVAGTDGLEDDNQDAGDDAAHRVRLMGGIALSCLVVAGAFLFLFSTLSGGGEDVHAQAAGTVPGNIPGHPKRADLCPGIQPSALVLSRMRICDTIYTTDDAYLEINLARQVVTVHKRDGTSRTFLISSGNKFLSKGISTPTGFFTVQNKTPLAISKQFNDAKLYNWIGVQGGVGFHALSGTGYYWNLGKHPSSHGCIRMSHDEVGQMYKMVEPGMPIISHYGNPARVVAFCDPDDTIGATLIDSASVYDRQLGKPRLKMLFDGNYWTEQQPRLVHLRGQRLRWGMECGDAKNIPAQKIPDGPSIRQFIARSQPVAQPDRAFAAVYAGDLYRAAKTLDSIRYKERQAVDKALSEQDAGN